VWPPARRARGHAVLGGFLGGKLAQDVLQQDAAVVAEAVRLRVP
jgi:hypothetical protein